MEQARIRPGRPVPASSVPSAAPVGLTRLPAHATAPRRAIWQPSAAVSVLLLLTSAGACLVPALRASRVNPRTILRG